LDKITLPSGHYQQIRIALGQPEVVVPEPALRPAHPTQRASARAPAVPASVPSGAAPTATPELVPANPSTASTAPPATTGASLAPEN